MKEDDTQERSDVADTGTDTSGTGNAAHEDDSELEELALAALEEGARMLAKKRRPAGRDVLDALERVLAHAESHGEAYTGAVSDHTTVRAFMTDQYAAK